MKTLYTSQVQVTSGRDGRARSPDGLLDLRLGFPKELGGSGDALNPEQLFAAGYAACFASSVKAAAAKLGLSAGDLQVAAQASLAVRDDGSYLISHVALQVQAPGLREHAGAVLAEARRLCAYSNTTHGNTVTDITLA
jgi:Ohr subfamily peroxiredoxin